MQNINTNSFTITKQDTTITDQTPRNGFEFPQEDIENVGIAIKESYDKLYDKLQHWLDIVIVNIPNIILAFIVLFIGFKLIKIFQNWTRKFTSRIIDDISVVNLIVNIMTIFHWIFMLFLILSIFDLDATINKILATAGVVGLAVGLALQEPLTNLFSGIQMSIQHPYSIGDIVETNGHFGRIKKISLNNTEVTLFSGENVVIPNKLVIQQSLKNFSNNPVHRITVEVGVEYDTDLEKAKEVIIETIKEMETVIRNKPVEVYYTEFGDSSINMKVMFWHLFKHNNDLLETKSNAIMKIKKALEKENITIPFPITTIRT